MQGAYSAGMEDSAQKPPKERPYRVARRLNFLIALEMAGGPTQLGLLTDSKKNHYSAIKAGTRELGDELAAKIEAALHLPDFWMDELHPELYKQDVPTLPRTLGELAQSMSHPGRQTLLLTWGETMELAKKNELPDYFRVKMPDKSMVPRVNEGRELMFTTREHPKPGDGVLVVDRDDRVYVRVYRERRPGVWIAKAENSDFDDLEVERDGLRVVAVLVEAGRWSS